MGYLALSLLALPAVLLAIPLEVSVLAQPAGEPRMVVIWRWLFGVVRGRSGEERQTGGHSRSHKNSAKRKQSGGSAASSARRGLAFLREAGGVERALQLLGDVVATTHPRLEGVVIEVGLGDPADTGQAWALLGPLSAWLTWRFAGEASLRPSFFEERLAVSGQAHLYIVPLYTLWVAGRYLLSPQTVRGLMAAREAGQ